MEENAEEQKPTSIIYDHCVRVYEEMHAQSREEELDFADPGDGEFVNKHQVLVYEGHLTKLFAGLQLSTPYYTSVMNHLKAMGCVEQLRRGGGNSPSRWMLVRPPAEEAFNSIENQKRLSRGKVAALEQQVRDLSRTVADLYARVDALTTLAQALSTEVGQLRTRLAVLETDAYGGKTPGDERRVSV